MTRKKHNFKHDYDTTCHLQSDDHHIYHLNSFKLLEQEAVKCCHKRVSLLSFI